MRKNQNNAEMPHHYKKLITIASLVNTFYVKNS